MKLDRIKNLIEKASTFLVNCGALLKVIAAKTGVVCVTALKAAGKGIKAAAVASGKFLVRVYAEPIKEIVRTYVNKEGRFFARLKETAVSSRSQFGVLAAHTVPVICAALFVSAAVTVANTDMAFKVVYGGEVVGYVTDEADYHTTIDRINDDIAARFGEDDYLLESEAVLSLAAKSDIITSEKLYNNILTATATLKKACGIYSDGELVAICADAAAAERAVEARLEAYRSAHENCGEVSIAYSVEMREGLYPADSVLCDSDAADCTASLSVMENVVETYNTDIAYKTVSSQSSKYARGTTVVQTEGKKGVRQVTAKVSYIDGVEVSREEVESKVVSEPVNKVVVVGTKKPVVSQAAKVIWPLDANAYTVITAYWGDGRDHKAIDIACNKGTAILAAKSGTVVETSKSHPTYGYFVLIDHGNGIKTRYAHCSAISVKVGDTVSGGQVIGAVGNTGRSTGPHLHFEYILNGDRIDPAPYLGV